MTKATDQSRRFSFALAAIFAIALAPATVRAQTNPWAVPDPSHAIFSCGDLTVSDGLIDSAGINGTATTHRGDLASNGNIKLSNGTIDGNATPGPGKTFTRTGGTITGTTTSATSLVPCTPIDLTALATTLKTTNSNANVPKATSGKDPLSGSTHTDFSLSGGDHVTLPAGTYYFTKFSMSGASTVSITGNVNILVNGAVSISGGSVAGSSSYQLHFWSTATNFSFSSATLVGFIYAPSGTINLSSDTVKGTVFANAVSVSGGAAHITRIIDDAAPRVAITFPTTGTVVPDPAHVTVTGTASDDQGAVTVTVNGQAATVASDGTFSVTINVGTTSPATITAIATDGGGNTAQASVSVSTTPATPPPTVTLTSPASGSLVATTTVDLTGTVTNAISVTVNGLPATINSGIWTLPQFNLGPDGVHTLTIVASGPGGPTTIKPTIENDTLAPAVAITSPQTNACVKDASVFINGTVSDPHLRGVTAALGTNAPVNATITGGTFTATLPAASEGKFVFTINATDSLGHTATALGNVTVDRTKPAISVTSNGTPFKDGAYKQPLSLFVRVTDADPNATLTTALNGNTYVSGTPITADATYTLTASAADCAGNASDPVTIHFTIDTVAPKITIAPLSGTLVSGPTNVSGTTDGATSVALDGLGITATVSGTNFTFTNLPLVEGVNNFTILATDAAGNQSRTPYSLTLDSTAPVVSITNSGSPIVGGTVFRQSVTPVITANEDATITATLNSQPFTSGKTISDDGSYNLAVTATDQAGHTVTPSLAFTIAKNGPAVQITSPAANATINAATTSVKVTATGSNVVRVRVNGVVATLGGDGYTAVVPLDPGPNVLTAIATDANGNSGTASINVVRDDGKLAILLIAPADNTYVNHPMITVAGQLLSAAAGGTVTINGTSVTADATGAFRKSDFAVVEGDNTITATVTAPNGNTNSVSAHIHGDFTPPVVHVTADDVDLQQGASFATSPTIKVVATDANQPVVAVTLDGAPAIAPISGLASGGHAISVVVTDLAKNMTRIDRSFAIGTTSATCTFGTFDPPDGSAVYEANVKISGQSTAANVLVNGQPANVTDGSFTATVALQTGRNDISIQCADANGHATSDPATTLTLYRYTESTITITSPQPDALFTTGKATVTGTVGAGVVSGDVNGIPFVVPADGAASHTFSVPDVGLVNGLNVLTARAVTSSSRVVMTNVHVLFLAATPQITITSPLPGMQTGAATINVTGNYTNVDPSTIQITVGSSTLTPPPPTRQSDTTGTFRITVPLAAGATTTITATGRNRANAQATSSVDVKNVADAPFITIDTPADGTTYGSDAASPANITGSISTAQGALVQVNGVPATIGANFNYSASIAFSGTSGITPVIARVSTPDGQTATESIRIVKLAKPFAVSDSFPANNATSVDPGAMIVLLFTNPLDGSTLSGALTLHNASGATVEGETFVDKDALSFAPQTPLTPGVTYTFTVVQSLHDIAGGTLASPFTLVFTVATTAPDSAPSVDQSDASGCIKSTTITGHASTAGARLRLDIDGVSMTTTAAADKSFKFEFSISGQSGYHIARVREVGADGTLSPDKPITYRINCAGPSVVGATLDRVAKKLTIQFSTAMNASTLTASPTGTIQLAPKDGTAVTGTVALDASGQIATVTTTADLSADTITLVIKKEVQDATGVTMAADDVRTFTTITQTPIQAGQGYVTGAVYDATTGRPLAGVQIDTAAPVNAFGKHATTSSVRLQPVSFSTTNPPTDDRGRYTRALAEGAYTIQASASGYTTVWRQVVVPAGSGVVPIDIRLTRRSAEQTFGGAAITLASGGDTAVTEPAELALTSASLASGKKIALTSVGGQSLAGLLPLGWSPIGSAEIEIDNSPIPAPLTAKLTFILSADQVAAVNAAAQSLALAQYDSDRDEWRTVAPVTIIDANRRATFDITSSGNYALVYPDKQTTSVQAPQPAASGAALQGVPNPCSASTTACSLTNRSFILNPSSVAPNGRTVATLTVDGASVFPSGTAVQAYIDEQLNLTDGRVLIDPPFATDLLVYRSLASDTGVAQFHLAPTTTAATAAAAVTLRDGVDHIRVVDYPGRIDRGALIGSEGGRVPGDGSVTIEIPTGAVLQPVHASSAAITTLPSNIAGFQVAGGFTFTTGGATLLKPARATFTVAANGAQVILAEELGASPYGLMYRLAAQTQKIGDNLYSTTTTALPVDGLIREGRYFILVAQQPIAFAHGRVVFVTGAAAPDARVTSGTPILGVNDLTRAGGTFAIPVPATTFNLTPRHITTGDGATFTAAAAAAANAIVNAGDLTLTIDAPKLVSVTPTGEIDATSAFIATAQFDRAIDLASATGAFTVTNLTTGHQLAGTVTGSANSIAFTSSEPLAAASRYAITVGATIRATNGAPLGQVFVQPFSTRAVPVNSSINAANIRITIPDANGQSIVSGTFRALPAGAQALAVRRNRAFITQYQATVAGDGSFSFVAGNANDDRITIADAIDLNVIDAVSRSTIAVIPLTPFVTANGTGFVAPIDTTTKFTAPDGTTVTVPAGAFAQPTIVTVTSGTKADFATVPNFDAELNFAAAVHLNFDGIANKPLDIELPIPNGVSTTNRNFVLGILGNSMRGPRVMIVDTLAVANGKFTTAATAGSSQRITASVMSAQPHVLDTLVGQSVKTYLLHAIQSGIYSALDIRTPSGSAVGWGVIDGLQSSTELFFDAFGSLYESQLYLAQGRGRIVVPMPSNKQFTVEGVDAATGQTTFTKSYEFDSTDPGFAAVLPTPANAGVGPYPMSGSPARIETIDLATQGQPLTSIRGYTVTLNSSGVSVTPDTGFDAAQVVDVTTGSMELSTAKPGDRLLLVIPEKDVAASSAIRVTFSTPIAISDETSPTTIDASLKQLFSLQACGSGGGSCIDITSQPTFSIDSTHRTVTVSLGSELQRGSTYHLKLSRNISETGPTPRKMAQTAAGSTLTDDLYMTFTVRDSKGSLGPNTISTGAVRDLALDGNILLLSALDGGIQAYDISDPAGMPSTPMAVAPAPSGGETWAVVTDRHGRVFSTELSPLFGLVRSYRLRDFMNTGGGTATAPLRSDAIVSWRPGANSGPDPNVSYTTLSDRPEATPRKIQLATVDDENVFDSRAEFEAATGAGGANILGATATIGSTSGEFKTYSVTIPFEKSVAKNPYRVQPATVENLTLGARWSADAVDGTDALINNVLVRAGDHVRISRSRTAYGVVSLFGYGVAIVDLNAMESNGWPNPKPTYKPLGIIVGITNAPSTSPCTGEPCPIPDLTLSPDATIQPAGNDRLSVVALDSLRGMLDLTVAPPQTPAITRNGPGLILTGLTTPPADRLATLRAATRGSSLIARFNSIAHYTTADGRNYALVAAAQFGLLVFDLDSTLSNDALADIIWIPAGAWGVRTIGSHYAAVIDGAGRTLLVDLSNIDERSSVTTPTQLFPTVAKCVAAGTQPVQTDFGADDPRIIWKSQPGTVATTLPPVGDPDTGFLFSGNVLSKLIDKLSAIDPTLRVKADLGSGPTDVGSIVPAGINPPANVVAGNGSLSAFRVETTLPSGTTASGDLVLAVESERLPGYDTPQTPDGLPRSHFRTTAPDGSPDPRASTDLRLRRLLPLNIDPTLKFQKGSNLWVSNWVRAVADPRASKTYTSATDQQKADAGCAACPPPAWLPNDSIELWSGGRTLRIHATGSIPNYDYLGNRLSARIGTIMADASRPADKALAAQNPAPAGAQSEAVVLLHDGEVATSATDMAIKGRGLDFVLARSYDSAVFSLGPLGRSIDSNLFARVRALPDGSIDYFDGTGRRDRFTSNGDGTFMPPAGIFLDLSRRADGTFILVYPDRTVMTFDPTGRLSQTSDRNRTQVDGSDGNTMHFVYRNDGLLNMVIDATGRTITLGYQSGDLLSSVTDFDHRTVTYGYDTSGRLKTVTSPDPQSTNSAQQTTTYSWTAAPTSGDLKQVVYLGSQLGGEIDGLSRTVWSAGYQGSALPWSAATLTTGGGTWYFTPGELSTPIQPQMSVLDPNNHTWTYGHDPVGNITSATAPPVGTSPFAITTYGFDAQQRLASVTRPLGDATVYSYGGGGEGKFRNGANVTAIIEKPRSGSPEAALNLTRVTQIAYGTANLPTSITAPDNAITTIKRDERGNPKTITDAANVTTGTTYDSFGRLMVSNDPRSGTATLKYFDGPSAAYLNTVTTSAGTITYTVNARGNVTQVLDAAGNTATYTLNKLDQIETETKGLSQSKMTYDATGELTTKNVLAGFDANGSAIYRHMSFEVDPVGRLTQRIDDSQIMQFGYDGNGNLTTLTRTSKPAATFGYDARNRFTSEVVGSQTTAYGYDEDGAIASLINARGKPTTFQMSGFSESSGDTNPIGVRTVSSYDPAGRPIDIKMVKTGTDGKTRVLQWSRRTYDPLGRITKNVEKLFTSPLEIPADGSDPTGATDVVTQTAYDDTGRITTVTDPRGNTTVTKTDDLGRPVKITDAIGNTMEYSYNGNGQKISETVTEIGAGGTQEISKKVFDYNSENRLASEINVTDPARWLVTTYLYDEQGNLTAVTDPEGSTTEFKYDLRRRRTSQKDPAGGVTKWSYDDADRVISIIDPNSNETRFSYDPKDGNLVSEQRLADGATWSYTYDENFNRKTITDPNATTVTLGYDDLDRLTSKQIAKGPGVAGPSQIAMTLDDLGRTVGITTDEGIAETFAYDSLGRQLSESLQIGSGPRRTVSRSFDPAGNTIALIYPSGLSLTYDIDAIDRISAVHDASSPTTPIVSYADVGGRLTSKVMRNGIAESWSYDSQRRLSQIVSNLAGATVRSVQYNRTPVGSKIAAIRPDLQNKTIWSYNANHWMTSEALRVPLTGETPQPESSTSYDIDDALNFRSVTHSTNTVAGSATRTARTSINGRNQYTQFDGETLTHDHNGNLASRNGLNLQYDFENRLSHVRFSDGTTFDALHDPAGRKVQQKVTQPSGSAMATDYVLSGDQAIEEYTAGSLAARYVHGRDIDEIVRADVGSRTVYPLVDELGSVERLTDAAGATIERYEVAGYGTFRIFAPNSTELSASSVGWKWLFQGREYNSSLASYDFRARTLWPDLGRFGQEDPAKTRDDKSRYEALGASPANQTDPTGLYEEDVHHYMTRYLANVVGYDNAAAEDIGYETGQLDYDDRSAMIGGSRNEAAWAPYHFVSPQRLNQMRQEVFTSSAENDRSIGEYLHALEDSYSHQTNTTRREWGARFFGQGLWGHGARGHDPDQTWRRPGLAMLMAEDVHRQLGEICNHFGSRCGKTEPFEGRVRTRIAAFIAYEPELFLDRIDGLDVETVRDYTAKIKLLDRSYEIAPFERDERERAYQDMVERMHVASRNTTSQPPNGKVPSQWMETP